jgi:hypothetical protein
VGSLQNKIIVIVIKLVMIRKEFISKASTTKEIRELKRSVDDDEGRGRGDNNYEAVPRQT